MVAGLLLVSRDWCWDEILSTDHPQRDWAIEVLRNAGCEIAAQRLVG
jgi:hypothetical protein